MDLLDIQEYVLHLRKFENLAQIKTSGRAGNLNSSRILLTIMIEFEDAHKLATEWTENSRKKYIQK